MKGYKIIRSIGKGGMGEVFLAHDLAFGRDVALKQMRPELSKNQTMRNRFLREARIAAQLTHPAIISIYSISQGDEAIFYTMPYVEGKTLRQLVRDGASIPTLMRIYLNVCQAIAYCHSKGILHRDLKPENVMIGRFGEVLLLDWGLADFIGQPQVPLPEAEFSAAFDDLTRPGKVPGTITYMPPERALGEPDSVATDIYALGVMLYLLLTLKTPFKRTTLESFRKSHHLERLVSPLEMSPYREIPQHLADVAIRCLTPEKTKRYQSVADLVAEIESYVEGRPEWIPIGTLDLRRKGDWEFQENVLLAKHTAITRSSERSEWVTLMISKGSFAGNVKLETKVRAGPSCQGIGLLLNIPESAERRGLEEGYCLWIGPKGSKLYRNNVEVMVAPSGGLTSGKWHQICLEKSDNHLKFYLDGALCCHYISHVPMRGTHVGMMLRDGDCEIEKISVATGSQNLMVSCLAIPDSFLASKLYDKALTEYRRIAYSFPGRAEGREALFRAGITLLQQQKYAEALEIFGSLRTTPGAPLEYLGKSLVYRALGDGEEEAKCLELAIRKYAKHPLRHLLSDHIIFRLHEASARERIAAYRFALIALRQIPEVFQSGEHARLIESLKRHLELPPHFKILPKTASEEEKRQELAIQLCFWLAKPIGIIEFIEEKLPAPLFHNCLAALHTLRCDKWAPKPFRPKTEKIDFSKHSAKELTKESHPLYVPYGCWLWKNKGKKAALAHFASAIATPFPPTTSLLAHALQGHLGDMSQSFFWEKAELLRQEILLAETLKHTAKVRTLKRKQTKLWKELHAHLSYP